jgi:pyrroline-5-carboxylate reductase
MKEYSLGFIGGGRITRIMLGGLKRAGKLPVNIVVSDNNADVLKSLQQEFPDIVISLNNNTATAAQDLVFVALHPPVMGALLTEIRSFLKPDSIVISLAPKLSIAKISEMLGGFQRIVRSIPNAPSIINEGYNPLVFSSELSVEARGDLKEFFAHIGECPEVEESTLEAYAMISAMGPTYLWFQLYELQTLAESFGISRSDAVKAIKHMVTGTVDVIANAGLSPAQVMDLIPVKPLSEDEAIIKEMYQKKLSGLYQKLTGRS